MVRTAPGAKHHAMVAAMIVASDRDALETQIKGLRNALRDNSVMPGSIGTSSRLALAVFPDFIAVLAAEIRQGKAPGEITTAVADLAANLIASVASTLYLDPEQRNGAAEQILNRAAVIAANQFRHEDAGRAPKGTEH